MVGDTHMWAWAISDEAAPLRATITPGMGPGPLAKLRSRWTPEQIAVVSELVAARDKARTKFPGVADRLAADRTGVEMASSARDKARTKFPGVADRLAADRTGVEMASSARAAAHKAARFVEILGPDASITDACCGIGGDAMSLVDAGLRVLAIDSDPVRAWMAAHNAGCPAETADIRTHRLTTPGLHIDPARRTGQTRTRDADAFDPPLTDLLALLDAAEAGALKLHPGVAAETLPPGELEIISESGRLTQAVLWTGGAVRHERSATLLAADGSTHHLAGPAQRPFDTTPVGAWVHTFDPAVERADLVGMLLEQTGLALVHPGAGLLTCDDPSDSPWVRSFRVVESMPWNFKGVRARLRELDAGEVTVKTRGGLVEPDRLSRELRGKSGRPLVLFALRLGDAPVAVITEPSQTDTPPDGACPSGGVSGVSADPAVGGRGIAGGKGA